MPTMLYTDMLITVYRLQLAALVETEFVRPTQSGGAAGGLIKLAAQQSEETV